MNNKQKFVHYAMVTFTYGVGLGTAYVIGLTFLTIFKRIIL